MQTSAQYIPNYSKQIAATPGWAIPVGKFGWGYVANKHVPVCARCLNYGAAFTWGLAPNSTTLMPCIPDLRPVGRDWIDYSNYLLWFVEVEDFCYGHARAAAAMQTAYAQSNVGLAPSFTPRALAAANAAFVSRRWLPRPQLVAESCNELPQLGA